MCAYEYLCTDNVCIRFLLLLSNANLALQYWERGKREVERQVARNNHVS